MRCIEERDSTPIFFHHLLPASVLALQQAGHPLRGESHREASGSLEHRQRPGFLAARFLEKAWLGRQPRCRHHGIATKRAVPAPMKGLLYFRSNRLGSVSSLARFLKSKEDLAARLYDLILPGTTRDGTIN